MIIYKIENKINNKIYIGLTSKYVSKRIAEHINNNYPIGKALRKYGLESFNISTIDNSDSVDILYEKEKYWIKFYNCKDPNGYNLTEGGDGKLGCKHTEETKKKISDGGIGLKRSQETRDKIRMAMTGKKNGIGNKSRTGQPMSDEAKRKISEATRGIKRSEETRKKISSTRIQRKIGVGNKYSLGYKRSAETIEKWRESKYGTPKKEETEEKNGE